MSNTNCPMCGAPGYAGLFHFECATPGCTNYAKPQLIKAQSERRSYIARVIDPDWLELSWPPDGHKTRFLADRDPQGGFTGFGMFDPHWNVAGRLDKLGYKCALSVRKVWMSCPMYMAIRLLDPRVPNARVESCDYGPPE